MVFFNAESYYDRSREDSAGLSVERAVIRQPGGGEQPGVAFRNGGHPKFIVDAECAYRVAAGLVDILDEIKRRGATVKRDSTVNDAFSVLADR